MSSPACRYYLPPEWAPQSGVMLTWPHAHGDWASSLPQVEPVFVEIAREVARREKVLIVCYDEAHREHIARLLENAAIPAERRILKIAPSNDTWSRDHGPITVLCQNEPLMLDFRFNGWGGKYAAEQDDAINHQLYRQGTFGEVPLETEPLVLEGGAIDVDGSGTLLTTTRCLLARTRNSQLSREQIETRLRELLGLNRVLWLRHGYLAGDDTDSHVDTLARFCNADTIAYVACDDPQDEHYAEFKAMENELRAFRAATGRPYRLVPLPWPRAKFNEAGRRLPATYANFLIVNGAVLVPLYDDPADAAALAVVQQCFPEREVIGIDCVPLIQQYGSLHCITMQLPAGVL